jgi:hypothetical protein
MDVVDNGRKHRWRPSHRLIVALILIGLLVVAGAGAWLSYRGYNSSSEPSYNNVKISDVAVTPHFDTKNSVVVLASVRSVSPDERTAVVRLRPVALGGGRYAAYDGGPLNQPITLYVQGEVGDPTNTLGQQASYSFAAAEPMLAVDTTIDLTDASAEKYPFDSYTGTLGIEVKTDSGKPVPAELVVNTVADGWHGSSVKTASVDVQGSEPGLASFDINIDRSAANKVYAVFMLILMWALALAGIAMALTLIRNKNHKIDSGPLTYLAALLFAFPLIRSSLPGNPALGVLADFAAYFWVEVVVAITLLALLITWIRRERRAIAEEEADAAREDGQDGQDGQVEKVDRSDKEDEPAGVALA